MDISHKRPYSVAPFSPSTTPLDPSLWEAMVSLANGTRVSLKGMMTEHSRKTLSVVLSRTGTDAEGVEKPSSVLVSWNNAAIASASFTACETRKRKRTDRVSISRITGEMIMEYDVDGGVKQLKFRANTKDLSRVCESLVTESIEARICDGRTSENPRIRGDDDEDGNEKEKAKGKENPNG